jgi:hypothetical protein
MNLIMHAEAPVFDLPGATFSFRVGAQEPFRAVACMRAGGQATLDGETFAPPWTV